VYRKTCSQKKCIEACLGSLCAPKGLSYFACALQIEIYERAPPRFGQTPDTHYIFTITIPPPWFQVSRKHLTLVSLYIHGAYIMLSSAIGRGELSVESIFGSKICHSRRKILLLVTRAARRYQSDVTPLNNAKREHNTEFRAVCCQNFSARLQIKKVSPL
jgi:hypothetical protein